MLFLEYLSVFLHKEKNNLPLWTPGLLMLGILIYFQFKAEPELWVLVILIPFALLTILFKSWAPNFFSITFLIILGFIAAQVRTYTIYHTLIKEEQFVKGIIGAVREINYKEKFKQITLEHIESTKLKGVKNLRLVVRTAIPLDISIGDIVILNAKLIPPSTAMAPYAYDFAKFAYFAGISAVGYATSPIYILEKKPSKKLWQIIESMRHKIEQQFKIFIKSPNSAIASALTVGKRGNINEKILEVIRSSGLAHLLAISGLHLTLVAFIFFKLIRNLLAISSYLTLEFNIKKIAAALSIVPTIFYLLISGAPISAQRAFVMILLVLIAILLDKKVNALRSLCFTAFIILLTQPEALFKPSFQMSFSAVLVLIATYKVQSQAATGLGKLLSYMYAATLSSLFASLATAAYTAYNFNYFSLSGIFSNLLAIPLTTFLILPLAILSICSMPIGLAKYPCWLLDKLIDLLLWIAHLTASIPYSNIPLPSFPGYALIIITLGGLWLFLWESKIRVIGILIIIVGVGEAMRYNPPDILVSSSFIALKDYNKKLYFIAKKIPRDFVAKTWLLHNGQTRGFLYKEANFLNCSRGYCISNLEQVTTIIHYYGKVPPDIKYDIFLDVRNKLPTIYVKSLNTLLNVHVPCFIWLKPLKFKDSNNYRFWSSLPTPIGRKL